MPKLLFVLAVCIWSTSALFAADEDVYEDEYNEYKELMKNMKQGADDDSNEDVFKAAGRRLSAMDTMNTSQLNDYWVNKKRPPLCTHRCCKMTAEFNASETKKNLLLDIKENTRGKRVKHFIDVGPKAQGMVSWDHLIADKCDKAGDFNARLMKMPCMHTLIGRMPPDGRKIRNDRVAVKQEDYKKFCAAKDTCLQDLLEAANNVLNCQGELYQDHGFCPEVVETSGPTQVVRDLRAARNMAAVTAIVAAINNACEVKSASGEPCYSIMGEFPQPMMHLSKSVKGDYCQKATSGGCCYAEALFFKKGVECLDLQKEGRTEHKGRHNGCNPNKTVEENMAQSCNGWKETVNGEDAYQGILNHAQGRNMNDPSRDYGRWYDKKEYDSADGKCPDAGWPSKQSFHWNQTLRKSQNRDVCKGAKLTNQKSCQDFVDLRLAAKKKNEELRKAGNKSTVYTDNFFKKCANTVGHLYVYDEPAYNKKWSYNPYVLKPGSKSMTAAEACAGSCGNDPAPIPAATAANMALKCKKAGVEVKGTISLKGVSRLSFTEAMKKLIQACIAYDAGVAVEAVTVRLVKARRRSLSDASDSADAEIEFGVAVGKYAIIEPKAIGEKFKEPAFLKRVEAKLIDTPEFKAAGMKPGLTVKTDPTTTREQTSKPTSAPTSAPKKTQPKRDDRPPPKEMPAADRPPAGNPNPNPNPTGKKPKWKRDGNNLVISLIIGGVLITITVAVTWIYRNGRQEPILPKGDVAYGATA